SPRSSSPLSGSGNLPIMCERCREVCRGEVVRVKNTHFHVHCFTCHVCSCDLVHSGFFHHSGEYICTEDYQRLYGTQCDSCEQYITGEVVSALGRTYHPHCFHKITNLLLFIQLFILLSVCSQKSIPDWRQSDLLWEKVRMSAVLALSETRQAC
uniref:LIM zinc-binding domain-containing protein n=1 Tax=Kryptolebias marmoratus TaxID=37003 RepID=A0A3Q3FB25_KRYMA